MFNFFNFLREKRKVVTANYLDHNAAEKWLIRDKNVNPKKIKPFAVKAIIATGVEFASSGFYEHDFACSVVAVCGTVKGYHKLPNIDIGNLIRLGFNGVYFYNNQTKTYIEKVDILYLDEIGRMWANEKAHNIENVLAAIPTEADSVLVY